MIPRSTLHLFFATLTAAVLALGVHEAQATPLQGAWKIVRMSLTAGEQPSFSQYTQPGLVLFTARHYSLMYVEGNEPRQMFRDPFRPTDAEKVDAFDTFVGHSGTYSLEDSIVVMQVEIAKVPNLAGPELRSTFARFAYQIAGDTLRLTRRTPRGAFTMQLIRVQ
jgi:hypothetical protein